MDLASASAKRMNVFAPVIKITEVSQSINFFVVMDNTFFFFFSFLLEWLMARLCRGYDLCQIITTQK